MPDARRALMAIATVIFAYQVLTTSFFLLSQRSLPFFPHALTGTAAISGQPLLRDWMFTNRLASWQPHRYLTAGFVHSGMLHLLLNMDAIRFLPQNLERTVGSDVFGTTFLLSTIAGHLGHSLWGDAVSATGAGAGIAGLYGLFTIYEILSGRTQGGKSKEVLQTVGQGMGRQLIYSLCLPRMFSSASTISGFLTGITAGLIFHMAAPKGNAAGSKNMAVWSVWLGGLSALLFVPTLRSAPLMVLRSLFQPGSLTMGRSRMMYKGI